MMILASLAMSALLGKPDISQIVHKEFHRSLDDGNTIGLSVGICLHGHTYQYNFGTLILNKKTSATGRTPYPIASITKTFTGLLLAQAVLEKKVKLDDDVRKYLPGDYANLQFDREPIRLWELLNHTSALPQNLPLSFEPDRDSTADYAAGARREQSLFDGYCRQDFFADLKKVTLDRKPGTKFSYSNAGAQLMGLILEKVYGKSYLVLVKDRITEPLGMTRTGVLQRDSALVPRAHCRTEDFLPAIPRELAAAGSLQASCQDMLRYLKWNLAESSAAVRLAHRKAGTTQWSANDTFYVGLNWQVFSNKGQRFIFQDGNLPGFSSYIAFCPEERLGIVLLSNRRMSKDHPHLSVFAARVLQAIDSRLVVYE
ncbi:MAG: beta-lactamase family protein [Armatimonadetes bacterium]|nr:beta-lactamase family protein [Armatimonadota bacterium]